MAIPTVNQNISGSFVPTTWILDVASIRSIDVNSDEFKELLVRLYQNLNRMVLSLNAKENGFYALNQVVTGKQYFPSTPGTSLVQQQYRPVTGLVINFGILPIAATKSLPHGIDFNAMVSFTHVYGTSTDPVNKRAISLPYASPTLIDNIELNVDATNVNVTTGIDRSNFTITYIVLEFLTQ